MSLTQAAVLVLGAFLIVASQTALNPTVKLIAGIAACVLVLVDVVIAHRSAA